MRGVAYVFCHLSRSMENMEGHPDGVAFFIGIRPETVKAKKSEVKNVK